MACCFHDFQNRRVQDEMGPSVLAQDSLAMSGAFGCREVLLTVSGTVTGVLGEPASGVTVSYAINGVVNTVTTNGQGFYSFTAPLGSCVSVWISPAIGVTPSPGAYVLWPLCDHAPGRNFTLFAVVPVGAVAV